MLFGRQIDFRLQLLQVVLVLGAVLLVLLSSSLIKV